VVGGRFVFTNGKLLVAGGLVLTPLMLFVSTRLELVAGGLAESLEPPGPQPVNATKAKARMATTETIDFINFIFGKVFIAASPLKIQTSHSQYFNGQRSH